LFARSDLFKKSFSRSHQSRINVMASNPLHSQFMFKDGGLPLAFRLICGAKPVEDANENVFWLAIAQLPEDAVRNAVFCLYPAHGVFQIARPPAFPLN
jgi:hypothetical protein